MTHTALVAWSGLLIGLVFGAVGQRSGFCLMSGLRQQWQAGDGRMLRSFMLALAVAILGSQAADYLGLITLDSALYIQPSFSWLLFLLGGVLFGYGMVLANGCGARALVLLGTGNLRSLVVLLMLGIAGHMTLTGLLAPLRLSLADLTSIDLPYPTASALLGSWGLAGETARWIATAIVAGALFAFAVSSRVFRQSSRHWLGGLLIGALIPAGWLATGYLGADDFDPVTLASLTFIAPVGDSIQYIMLSTGLSLSFGIMVILGIPLGAFAAAAVGKQLYLQGYPSPQRMLRYIAGGSLMGVGGALALGCSIGQGLTGLSTLALASFFAVAGIVLGALLGLRGPLRLPAV